MKNKIAFIGLGIMGANMASHLIKFNQLNIISRKSSKTEKFIRKFKNNNNLIIYDNLKELTKNSNIIISCVGNDKDLINIYLSKGGILENVNKNSIIVDHTTASAKISKEIYKKFYRKGSYFYDAPISGGEIGAINGSLSIMVGGHKKNFYHLKAILGLYSKVLIYMGKSGNGQLAKMVNQICVASIIQGLAEGLSFAKKKKLNIDSLSRVLEAGAAQSWQLENRAKTMWNNQFNFGFMNKLMFKDLQLVIEEYGVNKKKLPATNLIKKFYKELIKKGYSKEDTSNLIRLLN